MTLQFKANNIFYWGWKHWKSKVHNSQLHWWGSPRWVGMKKKTSSWNNEIRKGKEKNNESNDDKYDRSLTA